MKGLPYILSLLLLFLPGCTGYRTVPENSGSLTKYDIQVGDSILVIVKTDEAHEFKVTSISQTAVSGGNITINFDDILLLKKQEIDRDETVKSVAAGAGMGLGVALIILLGVAIAAVP